MTVPVTYHSLDETNPPHTDTQTDNILIHQ
ncbi:MAG: hypothetical protein K1060chlam1_00775 [Candidatus Anoxychlamydiales bacterium]|nr:hypothetical protein [Candidatus Anoxychlamydiales bacterium]